MGRSPLAQTFLGDPGRAFLQEGDQTWTAAALVSLAGRIARRVHSREGAPIGISAGSAAFTIAALLALWRTGRSGCLLDPALGAEEAHHRPGVEGPILVPAAGETIPGGSGETSAPPAGPDGSPARRLPSADEPLVSFLTSGSTGEPKLVTKKAFQIERQFALEPGRLRLEGPISVLSLVPPFHILGFVYGIYYPAASGGTTTFAPGLSPPAWIERIRGREPRLVVGVPSHYRLMAQLLRRPLPPAVYLCSGAPLPSDVGRSFREVAGHAIVEVYGSTESGGVATKSGEEPWRPLPGLHWRVDEESRLWIRAPWLDPPDTWERTDDLAAPDADGFRLIGRADTVVKIGGRRFSTAEVVGAAQAIPEVEAAVAVTYRRYSEAAVALFVTPRPGRTLSSESVRAFLKERLAAFKVPRSIILLESFPTRGIGKVDMEALRRLAEGE